MKITIFEASLSYQRHLGLLAAAGGHKQLPKQPPLAPKVLFFGGGWRCFPIVCIYIYIDLIVRIKAGASKKVDPPSQQCFPIKLKDYNQSITRDCPKVGKFRNTDGPFLNQWI
jgi:hypothetical protein